MSQEAEAWSHRSKNDPAFCGEETYRPCTQSVTITLASCGCLWAHVNYMAKSIWTADQSQLSAT